MLCPSWMKKAGVCLCLWLITASGKAWWQGTPEPREQYRHIMPMGRDFPGMPRPDAERVTETIGFSQHPRDFSELRLKIPPRNRKSTGLYRVPGEPVTISIRAREPESGSVPPWPLPQLVIGAHRRMPLIAQEGERLADPMTWFYLDEGVQRDRDKASGLIYLDCDAAGDQVLDITIAGAVRAPWFKLGRDSVTAWQETLRHAPAPWAELEGDRAILTVPSSMIRDLEDPEPIIRFYDQLVKDVNSLVGLSDDAPDARHRSPDLPFRLVVDPALSLPDTEYIVAQSGYPITLNWIFYGDPWIWLQPDSPQVRALVMHELGHNYEPAGQRFEPPGAMEAFANLIQYGWQSREGYWFLGSRTLWPRLRGDIYYAYLPLYGYPSAFLDSFLLDGEFRYDARIWVDGPEVSWVQKNAFMIRLIRNLSHEFIATLYSRFRDRPQEALPPRDNAQKKTDFFFELLCEVTQQDLSLFFQDWYVPVSDEAYQRVADKGYEVPSWVRHDGL